MHIVTLEGRALADLFAELGVTPTDVHTVRVAVDGDTVKTKVNEGMWTPGYPQAEEDARRRAAP
jgi:hypothetical protein